MELYIDADVNRTYDLANVDFPLGAKVKDQSGRYYVFCKYNEGDGAVQGTEGMIVVGLVDDYQEYEVTADVNSATITALRQDVKGIIVPETVDDGEGFFVQFAGRNIKDMIVDGTITEGMFLRASGATDGGAARWIAADERVPFALVLADASGTTLAAGDCRLWCPTVR